MARRPKLLMRNDFGSVAWAGHQLVSFGPAFEFSFSCLPGRLPTSISEMVWRRLRHCRSHGCDANRSEAANSSSACIAPVKLSCQGRKLNVSAEANIAHRTSCSRSCAKNLFLNHRRTLAAQVVHLHLCLQTSDMKFNAPSSTVKFGQFSAL